MNLDPGEPLHRRSRLAKATSFAVARFISRGLVRDHLWLHDGVHRQHPAQIGAVLASDGEYRAKPNSAMWGTLQLARVR